MTEPEIASDPQGFGEVFDEPDWIDDSGYDEEVW
jgi:hypothetical protein